MSGLEPRIPGFALRAQSGFAWQQVMKLPGAKLAPLAPGNSELVVAHGRV